MSIDLEAIHARLKAATPGPWHQWTGRLSVFADAVETSPNSISGNQVCELGLDRCSEYDPDPEDTGCRCGDEDCATCYPALYADAALIAHAPTDLANLCAEVERQRDVIAHGETVCDALNTELVALRAKLAAYEHVLRTTYESDPWAMASSTLAELGIDVVRTPCPCPQCAKGGEP